MIIPFLSKHKVCIQSHDLILFVPECLWTRKGSALYRSIDSAFSRVVRDHRIAACDKDRDRHRLLASRHGQANALVKSALHSWERMRSKEIVVYNWQPTYVYSNEATIDAAFSICRSKKRKLIRRHSLRKSPDEVTRRATLLCLRGIFVTPVQLFFFPFPFPFTPDNRRRPCQRPIVIVTVTMFKSQEAWQLEHGTYFVRMTLLVSGTVPCLQVPFFSMARCCRSLTPVATQAGHKKNPRFCARH